MKIMFIFVLVYIFNVKLITKGTFNCDFNYNVFAADVLCHQIVSPSSSNYSLLKTYTLTTCFIIICHLMNALTIKTPPNTSLRQVLIL